MSPTGTTILSDWSTVSKVSAVVGTGTAGFTEGRHLAQFNQPYGTLSPDEKILYLRTISNHAIRALTSGAAGSHAGGNGKSGFGERQGRPAGQFNRPTSER